MPAAVKRLTSLSYQNVVLEPREKYAEMAKSINFTRNLSQHQPASQLDMVDMDPTSDEAQSAVAKLLKPKIVGFQAACLHGANIGMYDAYKSPVMVP